MNHSKFLAFRRTVSFLLALVIIGIVQTTIQHCFPKYRFRSARWCFKGCCFAAGIRVDIVGHPYGLNHDDHDVVESDLHARTGTSPLGPSPCLYVSNHLSYLDIAVIGSILKSPFVAKQEISKWPIFGFMAKIGNTIFVERRASRAREQKNELRDWYLAGNSLIVFPEGTTNDGLRVLPFKSSLFSVVEDLAEIKTIMVQPLSVSYPTIDGLPVPRYLSAFLAWTGDVTLVSHFWQCMGLGKLRARVIFHPPLTLSVNEGRKGLAKASEDAVAWGVEKGQIFDREIVNKSRS